MFQMSLTVKKVDYIFEEPFNLHINVLFHFHCGFLEKIEPSWRNYFIWTANWDGEHNTLDTQNTLVFCLSAIAVMQVIFWTEDNFCFIFDCRNSFNCKLKMRTRITPNTDTFYAVSICKYWIEQLIEQMCKCALS